jgi:hypothetical protein
VRERLPALFLALLLGAGAALAQEEVEVETTVEEEAEPDSEEEEIGSPGYQEVTGQTLTLLEGEMRATLENGVLRPSRGYTPLALTLHNPGPLSHTLRIGVESHGSGRAEVAAREVEVGPRQRLVTWVPVPIAARGGRVRLRGPGDSFKSVGFFTVDATGAAVLVLGTERAFQAGTGLPRVERMPRMSVRFVALEEAPRELAAYVGHASVVVAGDVTALPADAWSALEAYAATGGLLVLPRPSRDVGERLPLLASTTRGVQPYGFGKVRLCGDAQECGMALLSDVGTLKDRQHVGVVSPAGPAPGWQRGRHLLNDGELPLLPGVQAPVGRFLFLIVLFVLAVGPGGLALARRKGPVALLIAVPSVALLTCLTIVAWSVLVDGFSLHAARYSLTWLDRARDRALTVGLSGYYANLEPEGVRVPTLGALLGSDVDWEPRAVEADWTNGMAVTGGFLPSRTYREWGEVAMVPTRARLTVRREGEGLRVQNALGAPLAGGYVRLGQQVWTVPALAEGAEGEASRVPASTSPPLSPEFVSFSEPVRRRFNIVPWNVLGRQLSEGDFIVKLEGPGLAPTAALPVELHEGLHFVRGRVDGP